MVSLVPCSFQEVRYTWGRVFQGIGYPGGRVSGVGYPGGRVSQGVGYPIGMLSCLLLKLNYLHPRHHDHPITRFIPTSYVMMRQEDVPSETSPLLPPRELKSEPSTPPTTRTYVPSNRSRSVEMPMAELPVEPPPAYEECTS